MLYYKNLFNFSLQNKVSVVVSVVVSVLQVVLDGKVLVLKEIAMVLPWK